MACLNFAKNIMKWRVRWRATNRKAKTNRIFQGSQTFLEKADAVKFYAEIEQQERQWRKGQIPGKTIQQVSDDYLRYAQQYTPRTQVHYVYVLKTFIASLPEDTVWIQQITKVHIREYLSRMLDAGNKNRTCNAHLTVIKSFYKYLNEVYDISNQAGKVHMFKEDPPKARFLKEGEYSKILDAADELAKNRIIFLANTGLRATEFQNLNLQDIELNAESITITGKGRKKRTVPLNSNAREILPELSICTKNALGLQFGRLARKAEIPKFGPHALRHYFATQLLLAGVPILKVSLLMGHSSVKTTQERYSHILPEDLSNITDVLVKEKPDNQAQETCNIISFANTA
jgi:integrase/recombinase XerC